MSESSVTTSLTIGVVGAGTMGRGIAQLLVQAGHRVRCHDSQPGAAAKAVDAVLGMLAKLAEKGKLDAALVASARDRLAVADELNGLAGCHVVVEAVVEDLEVKRALFRALEDVVGDDTILASNTSSLTVAQIAAACRRPERVAGLHFFNPVPLMKVAEVIAAVRTAPAVIESLRALVDGTGHRAVITADQPGFLINHAGRGLYTEGLRLLEEQVADVAQIDRVLREAAGFRMGPFELLDLTGLDVSSQVMNSIYEQFQHEPRFRPSSLVAPRVAAGLFGRKTGQGWYAYEGEVKVLSAEAPMPPLPAGLSVWVAPDAPQRNELQALAAGAGVAWAESAAAASIAIVQPWGGDATHEAAARGLDASRCVALDPLPGFALHRTLMLTVCTAPAVRDAARALLASDGTAVTVINDSPGFIVQRVLAVVINIAAQIAQRGIASVDDIDAAVKLGLGYPLGPLAWGDRIGADRLLAILCRLQALTGDPRYRPSPWLQRRVALGLPLRTPQAARA